jgi:hypothetical protein
MIRRLMRSDLVLEVAWHDPSDHVRSAEVLDRKPWRPSFAMVVKLSQTSLTGGPFPPLTYSVKTRSASRTDCIIPISKEAGLTCTFTSSPRTTDVQRGVPEVWGSKYDLRAHTWSSCGSGPEW